VDEPLKFLLYGFLS
jgi:hypothetical protein